MDAYHVMYLVAAGFWLLLGAGVPFFFFFRDRRSPPAGERSAGR